MHEKDPKKIMKFISLADGGMRRLEEYAMLNPEYIAIQKQLGQIEESQQKDSSSSSSNNNKNNNNNNTWNISL